MTLYFNISEFCITQEPIPQDIADAILVYHILPLNKCRQELGAPIWISQNSGYRPKKYELKKGRSGKSQHTFLRLWREGKGAVDVSAGDLKKLGELLVKHTKYNRITFYPKKGFYHCDYKPTPSGKREVYYNGKKGWVLDYIIK